MDAAASALPDFLYSAYRFEIEKIFAIETAPSARMKIEDTDVKTFALFNLIQNGMTAISAAIAKILTKDQSESV